MRSASPSTMAVLPTPAEHVHRALELALAADERVDAAGGRLLDQVDGEGGERIARRRGLVVVTAGITLGRRRLGRGLRDAVRQVRDDVEPRDALLGQEEGGVRVGLPEDRGQQVGAVDLVAAGRLHVCRRALEDALESERLLRWALVARGERLLLVEVRLQLLQELRDVATAGAHHVGHGVVVQERPEDVLQAEELVPAPACLAHRQGERRFEGTRQSHAQASSVVQRSGYSYSRARASTCETRVSATSRG